MSSEETNLIFNDMEPNISPNKIATSEISIQSMVYGVGDIISGLHQAIDKWRLGKAEGKANKLDETRFVYAESPDIEANLIPFRLLPLDPNKQDPKGRNRRSREVAGKRGGVPVKRPINLNFTPVSSGERRQAKRAANREAKSRSLRYQRQAGLRHTWGDDIGTSEFVQRISNARMSESEKRKALWENRRFILLGRKADRIHERVKRSARGEDIPGRVIQYRLDRSLDTIARLRGRTYDMRSSRIGGLLARGDEARRQEESLLHIDRLDDL